MSPVGYLAAPSREKNFILLAVKALAGAPHKNSKVARTSSVETTSAQNVRNKTDSLSLSFSLISPLCALYLGATLSYSYSVTHSPPLDSSMHLKNPRSPAGTFALSLKLQLHHRGDLHPPHYFGTAYFCVHSFAVAMAATSSSFQLLATSGARGSSGLGAPRRI